ncbi:TipJ family phage tail tip protein [Pseudomonas tussilaginis]|uniref:TipJ family phage tail tip protein n=1 Tax=Pseudomonas putida TaxID=303 RepID=UPI0023643EA6|nr:phage tail protein [Pseudomonas putida]MDD1977111.1 phage tail protein [Pseudomonas putida]
MGAAVKRKPRRATGRKRRQVVGSKGGAKKQKQPSIASNSVPSIATARMVYLWSWGPIVGPVNGLRSIKLDGTPIMAEDGTLNYPGVKWQFRSGELNQDRLQGVSESSNEIDVGQELKSTTPWVYTVSRDMADAVRLRFGWPQLQSQDSGGNINGVRIQYAVDISTDGGPYLQVLASEVNRKNITKYERSHRLELPAGSRWSIRARRLTPEANSSLVQDGMVVEAIAEVVDSDQEYPLTAVGCLEYDAQQFGGDIAKVAALMRGRIVRVPMNYDPETRTYATGGPGTSNGVWDGTFKEAYTNNPAWIFYDLAPHPYYGLGERIDASMINRWALYRIAQYCDQLVPDGKGGQEPRFTCNLYLQKQAEGWAVLQDLAAIFHGLAYWDGSQIVVNADMPQDSAYTYSGAQILGDGAIKYSGSKWRDRHSLAMVSFDDPAQGYETDKEPVFDEEAMADYGVREISVEAVGCTSRGQAQRAGQWALLTEQLQVRGATMRVGLDGYIPKPGKVISVADPMLAGRANGGRIAAVAGRVITLDRDIEVPTGARLQVNLPSGKAEARQVRSISGRQVTVMADYSEVPEAECGWALDYDDLKLMQFYVRNVTRPEWHQFQLELIQHEPSKFDAIDYGTVIDDRPISVLPPGVQDAPARVLITSHNSIDQGIAVTTMTIGWDAAPGAVAYDVEWRWGARDWIKLPRTGELSADVPRVYSGQYLARVRAVSAMDVASMPTTSVLTDIAGKTTPPPAVTHLLTTPLVYGTGLAWGFPVGAEDTERTEIWYSTTTSQDDAIKLGDFAYPQAEHQLHGLRAGVSFFYWARLIDRTGNIGPWYPHGVGVHGQSSADQSEYEEYFKDKIGNGALYPELREEIEKISGDGPGSVTDRLGQAKDELYERINQLTDALAYDPAKAYAAGDIVRDGQHLYQAKGAVPVGAAPPNATYWADIGTILQTANALASQVQQNTTDITNLDGKVTASASRLDALQAGWRADDGEGDLLGAIEACDAQAKFAQQVRTQAAENSAMVERITSLDAQVGANKAGLSTLERVVVTNEQATVSRLDQLKANVDGNTVAIGTEEQARVTADEALGQRIGINEATLGEHTARITDVEEAQVNADQSLATLRTTLDSVYTSGRDDTGEGDLLSAIEACNAQARFASETRTLADADQAQARRSDTLEASINRTGKDVQQVSASVQQVSEAVVGLNGEVNAKVTLKAQTVANGKRVTTGLAFGSDGETSEFLVFAQRFAILDEASGQMVLPFVVQGGQVFMNTAIINQAFIKEIIMGMVIRSEALDSKGRPLLEINFKAGTLSLRGQDSAGSTLLNNGGLYVYDGNDVERTAVGRLN